VASLRSTILVGCFYLNPRVGALFRCYSLSLHLDATRVLLCSGTVKKKACRRLATHACVRSHRLVLNSWLRPPVPTARMDNDPGRRHGTAHCTHHARHRMPQRDAYAVGKEGAEADSPRVLGGRPLPPASGLATTCSCSSQRHAFSFAFSRCHNFF
jgi:hypothetical protein